jgi:hypothetical protein
MASRNLGERPSGRAACLNATSACPFETASGRPSNGGSDQKTVRLLNKNGYMCCMQHIQGGDRNQTLLLPVAVDDYVGRENPVRFIEAFVDQCDLQAAGFRRVQPKDTGRPGYDPADLLKLYIYGYVNQVSLQPAARGGDRTAIWK